MWGDMMPVLEKKILLYLEKNAVIFVGVLVTIGALVVRSLGKDFVSGDMYSCLLPWFQEFLDAGGLKALNSQIGNYNILYQVIIALLSYIDMPAIYLYKSVSCFFDFALAFMVAYAVREVSNNKSQYLFLAVYTAVLFMPTVILNSSFWGQCDSIFSTFCVWALLLLYQKKYKKSFAILGIAFAFKLQAIFVIPFFIVYYVIEKRFSIIYFGLSFLTFYATCIPGFLCGRSLLEPIKIYMGQSNEYEEMCMNFPNIWGIFGHWYYYYMAKMAIISTIIALAMLLLFLMDCKVSLMSSAEHYMLVVCWSIWTCLMFLPAMHERYAYLLDVLLLMLLFVERKYWKICVSAIAVSSLTYVQYLFEYTLFPNGRVVLYIVLYVIYTALVVRRFRGETRSLTSKQDFK